jgi:hypothetical protein
MFTVSGLCGLALLWEAFHPPPGLLDKASRMFSRLTRKT